jgi:hypothetical protein
MQDYRAFIIGRNGHIMHRQEFWCESDEEAKERAKQLVAGEGRCYPICYPTIWDDK